jgi:hypothetical protein
MPFIETLRPVLRRLPEGIRWQWHRLVHQRRMAADHGGAYYARWLGVRVRLSLKTAVGQRAYRRLTPADVARCRRSDTVFVFGSGYSLNDLTPAEWRHFAAHDVFGFSGFVHQRWLRTDFHLVRGWDEAPEGLARRSASAAAYGRMIRENPYFEDTLYILHGDFGSMTTHTLVGDRLLPAGARICWYRTAARLDGRPSEAWAKGITHGPGTLADVVNVAYLLGWKRIVLVGVDMYDSRYFWGPPDATLGFNERGEFTAVTPATEHAVRWDERHHASRNGVIELLGAWTRTFAARGVTVSVYNPHSLLRDVMPVYDATSAVGS